MASPNRPGVEIIQDLAETPVVSASPTLVPVVVGICNQIIEVLDSDGDLNPDAKFLEEQYNQASLLIPQSSYPDPRDNIDEIEINEESVGASLFFGGGLSALARGSNGTFGQSFLEAGNLSSRAAIRTTEFDTFSFDATVGDVLTVALDVVNPVDVSRDVVVTLVGSLTAEEVVDEINGAFGADVAEVFEDADGDFGPIGQKYVQISSPTSGATSSVTLRPGTGALKPLFGAGFDDSQEYRVEGAGFRGQDDADNDLFTPWVEFYQGAYREDDADTAFPADNTSDEVWPGLIDLDGDFSNAKGPAQTFTGPSATVPLKAATSSSPGDQFWADGTRVASGEIIKLEPARFKMGRLNNALSTFDDEGLATTRVYDTVEVNIIFHGNAFAPKNAYFVADGLVWGSIVPAGVAASLTGSTAFDTQAERPAIIQSSSDISFPETLASLTIDYSVTEDGVESELTTFTFVGGPFATIGALVAALTGELPGITVSNSGDKLVLSTTKTGADQAISVKSTGTANTALFFSTTSETEDTGKDVEYAELAEVTGDLISLPLLGLSAETLDLTVVDSKGIHVLSAAAVDLVTGVTDMGKLVDAIAVAFGGTAITDRTLYNEGIPVATVETASDVATSGTITIKTLEGGTTVSLALDATDGTDGFRHLGFYDAVGGIWAEIGSTTPPITLPVVGLDGTTLTLTYDDGGGPYSQTAAVAGADGAATAVLLAAALNAIAAITDQGGSRALWFVGDDSLGAERLIVRTVKGGAAVTLDGTGAAGNTNASVDLSAAESDTGAVSLGNTDDTGDDTLKATTLGFFLDDNPFEYEATFTTNSLQDAIDEVNTEVGGATDVASEDSGSMVLTSLLKGSASKVEINDTSTGAVVLGLSGEAVGSGRPDPDFYLTGTGAVVVGPSILRNGTTGQPFSLESAIADVYVQYTALRKDVSAMAETPGILSFASVSDMEEAIGPISVANPLALGAFLALQNAPGVDVSVLGLDEANDASPEGTIDAWARALDLLQSKEVYTIAPLTGDEYVSGLLATHVNALSQPTERGERIVFIWKESPVTEPDTVVVSGSDAETNGTDNSLTLETNPAPDLINAGISLSGPIAADVGLYLEVLVVALGDTDLRRYSVEDVSGVVLSLRTGFAAGENDDGFYSTTPIDGSSGLDGLDWTLKIRGEPLTVAGTTRLNTSAVSEAAGSEAAPYASRRVYFLFADALDTSVDGITQKVPGYYASAIKAGMIAQQAPQQPFTNVPLVGVSKVYGTDDTFSENQMDTIADGGRYVLVNAGGTVLARHQRSTATTSIEERELSITKSIDWLAKGLRATNRAFIGRFVITPGFLDQLTMANQGFLEFAEQLGAVAKADLKNLLQDTSNPDTILIEVEVIPQFPANKIRITIVS